MADWEEIKRLAADFQRAQLSSTVQRLSERNCIEIVQKLVELNLLDIIYTTDGKEYLTPQELGKEIREELIVRGGRVNLVDLQSALNVDFSHVESKVNEIVRADKGLTLILGQLIDQNYVSSLAEEINDSLQEQGQVSLAQLATTHDLPGTFLSEVIDANLGTVIKGQVDTVDKNIVFTDAFVKRHKAIIRGAFSAITRPVTLSTILNLYGLNERLFFAILEELVAAKQLAGSLVGGRQERAQYIPDIYTRSQNEWVDNFYTQNGYLEYDTLSRIGISDPKSYIKKRLKSESLQYLSSCCIGRQLEERIEAEIDEALSNTGWLDVLPCLPSICTPNDASQLLVRIMKRRSGTQVFCDTVLVSDLLLSKCRLKFDPIIQSKAEAVARTNPGLLMPDKRKVGISEDQANTKEDRKDQRRKKAATGKSGGGTQGREVKTKSVKKKSARGSGRGDRDEDSDDEGLGAMSGRGQLETEFVTLADVEEELCKLPDLEDCPTDVVTSLAESLHRPLNKQFYEVAKSVFVQTAGGATGSARKKTHGQLSEKINGLWTNMTLFEKGLKYFGEETQAHLTKHLLRTICTDLTNLVFSSLAADHMVAVGEEETLSPEARLKMLAKIPDEKTKTVLTSLHGTVNGKSIEEFVQQLNVACNQEYLDIILKKTDKKKERQLVFHHRQSLAAQLRDELDPALALHLASVLLFTVYTQVMLHAPGRCVPQVIGYLREHMRGEEHDILTKCQDLIVQQLRQQNKGDTDSNDTGAITRELEELLPKVKDIAQSARKTNNSAPSPED